MTIWHICKNGKYFRVEGTAAAPVLTVGPIEIQDPPNAGLNFFVFSPDGGQTLWTSAWKYLLKSIDGGLNWTDESSHLPYADGTEGVTSMAVNPATGTLCATFYTHNGYNPTGGGIMKQDPVTGDWTNKVDKATWNNATAHNICVVDGVWFLSAGSSIPKGLWKSTDDGDTWVKDSTWVYTGWQGPVNNLAVDSNKNFCAADPYNPGGAWNARHRFGQFGAGPFTPTVIIPPDDWQWGSAPNPQLYGRQMGVDETDAFWLAIDNVANSNSCNICRRDPVTTLWSVEHTYPNTSTVSPVCVVDSSNIWTNTQGGASKLAIYDGDAWYEHTYGSIHASLGFTPAIWAKSGGGGGGGDLAGGPRFRVGFDPSRNSGPRQEDGSLQSDLQIATGVQNIAQFDGGTLED